MGLIQATSNGLLNLDQAVIMAQILRLYSNLLSYMANDGSDDWGSEYAFYGIDRIGAFLEQQTNMTTTIRNSFQNVLWPLAQEGGNYFAVTPTGSVDNNEQLFEWGNNPQISATMLINAVVANLTGNTNALSISMNELNWILGKIPSGSVRKKVSARIISPPTLRVLFPFLGTHRAQHACNLSPRSHDPTTDKCLHSADRKSTRCIELPSPDILFRSTDKIIR